MDYEKAYKKLKADIKKAYLFAQTDSTKAVLEHILPELRKSKDERARKRLIAMCQHYIECYAFDQFNLDGYKEALAWLEKQGEQNPIDKVGPKFHEGDWLCENELNNYARFIQILEIINIQGKERYRISRDIRNNEDIVEFGFLEKYYHKFDIKDAKEGDVLVASDESLFIFARAKDNAAYYHFSLCKNGSQEISDGKHAWEVAKDCHPATKEQHDLLFQKMHEAGYTFDFEKKELKKIDNEEVNGEDYGIDGLWHAQRILEKTLGEVDGYQTDDGILDHKAAITAVKKLYEQKPAAWSEEDERIYQSIIDDTVQENQLDSKQIDWLKSLKQRYTWKPRDEQMKALDSAIDEFDGYREFDSLVSLKKDLEKLKRE